ncbi:PKD domain-containing protein [Pontibacter sp. G13]|uniref:PKD domain-containing protein n=1 Tax=Pontibacter sp. G13 TaxID=3074898 RepID=UPI002889CE84|nr:PKD domain-containing protein [Pontibacter sp. G13]WNJ16648.1 PKD domain-containing protein [Pontibacter sp. G13]
MATQLMAQNTRPSQSAESLDLREVQASPLSVPPAGQAKVRGGRRKCGSLQADQDLRAKHPDGCDQPEDFENWMQEGLNLRKRARQRGSEEVYTIPVVVHVIYSNYRENIPDEQVFSQIEVLNQDYRRKNPDQTNTPRQFRNVAADTKIEFCLASVDPNGNPTNGIHRVSMPGAPFTERNFQSRVQPNTIWNPDQYMNIWVCNLADNVVGFAQFPASNRVEGLAEFRKTRESDGVVIHYQAFGTVGAVQYPFNKGRTATHEVGHWLGLRHIWGDNGCLADDYCNDTPPTAEANYECGSLPTVCESFTAPMIQNYMDYTPDQCMNLFTLEQKARMRMVLETSPRRQSLLRSGRCNEAVLPPTPKFTADLTSGCGPLKVQFKDLSEGSQLSYEWFFTGGKPERSTDRNPKVTFKRPGRYGVTLRVSNSAGTRTVSQEQYIRVLDGGRTLPFAMDAEEVDELEAKNIRVLNPDRDEAWALEERVSAYGNGLGSVAIPPARNYRPGSADWLILPMVDFSRDTRHQITFDWAYMSPSGVFDDTLRVMVATGCSHTFQAVWTKTGSELGLKSQVQQSNGLPTPDQWNQEVVDLSRFSGDPYVQIAIVRRSGTGNATFIDNFSVSSGVQVKPSSMFFADGRKICEGESLSFQDESSQGPTRWLWSFPGGVPASSSERNPKVRYDQAGTYAVSLTTFNDAGSHTFSQSQYVTVQAKPELVLTASKATVCQGEVVTLVGSGSALFSWEMPEGMTTPTGNSIQIHPEYDATYRIVSNNTQGCKASDEVTVRVRDARPFQVSPPEASVCPGSTVTLQVTGADEYRWQPAPGLSNTSSGLVKVTPSQTTTYVVEGTTDSGCTYRKEVPVKVENPDDLILSVGRQVICAGDTVHLSAEGAGAYTWSPASSLNMHAGNRVIASPSQTQTYTVKGTSFGGCEATRSIRIEVVNKPSIVVQASDRSPCPGATVEFNAFGAEQFRWISPEDGFSHQGANFTAQPKQPTEYIVQGISAYGCADTAKVLIKPQAGQALEVEVSKPVICAGEMSTLSVNQTGNFRWYDGAGNQVGSGSVIQVRPKREERYRVVNLSGSDCSSTGYATVKVALGGSPVASFEVDREVSCAGQSVTFTSSSSQASEYFWEFPTGIPSHSTDPNPVVKFPTAGYHTVALEVTGCRGGRDKLVREEFVVVSEAFDLNLNTFGELICQGSTVTLNASGGKTYEWSPAIGLNSTEGSTVYASPTESIEYTVTATDFEGCQVVQHIPIDVISTESALTLNHKDPVLCSGEEITLEAAGAYEYNWKASDGTTHNGPVWSVQPTKSATYLVHAVTIDGCEFQDSVVVEVRDSKAFAVRADQASLCEGEQTQISIPIPGTYQWAPNYGLSQTSGTRVTAFPRETTTYQVTGVDEMGCSHNGTVTIEVNQGSRVQLDAEKVEICAGDSTILRAKGGTSYSWGPALGLSRTVGSAIYAFPTETTTYSVVAAGAGCGAEKRITVVVHDPEPIVVTPQDARICDGSGITLEASGAKYYIWEAADGLEVIGGPSAPVKPAQTTRYTVHGMDQHGCLASGSATVRIGGGEFMRLAASTAKVCASGEVILEAEGATQYTWLSGPGISENTPANARVAIKPNQAGTYRMVGTNSQGCRDTASVRVEVARMRPEFVVSIDEIDLATESGEIHLEDKTPGATSWSWLLESEVSAEGAHLTHVFTEVGRYPITLQVSNGVCTETLRKEIRVINSSSLKEIRDEAGINIRYISENGRVRIAMKIPRKMFLNLRVLDRRSHQVLQQDLRLEPGPFLQELDLSSFEAGQYLVQISDGTELETKTITIP